MLHVIQLQAKQRRPVASQADIQGCVEAALVVLWLCQLCKNYPEAVLAEWGLSPGCACYVGCPVSVLASIATPHSVKADQAMLSLCGGYTLAAVWQT